MKSGPSVLRTNSDIAIVSQNIQGVGKNREKLDAMANLGAQHKTDINLFQETKIAGDEMFEIHGFTFFLHGHKDNERRAGVGIMLGPRAIAAWKRAKCPEPIRKTCADAGRFIGIEMHFQDEYQRITKVFAISAHLPHSNYTEKAYEECLNCLADMTDGLADCDIIPIIGGDFNARIGTRSMYDETAHPQIGKYGIQEINERGHLLMNQFILPQDFIVPSTFFEKKLYTTWTNNSTKMKDGTSRGHMIDLFLCRRRDRKRIIDCGMQFDRGVHSDHTACLTKLRIVKFYRRKHSSSCNTRPPQVGSTKTSLPKQSIQRDFWQDDAMTDSKYQKAVEKLSNRCKSTPLVDAK